MRGIALILHPVSYAGTLVWLRVEKDGLPALPTSCTPPLSLPSFVRFQAKIASASCTPLFNCSLFVRFQCPIRGPAIGGPIRVHLEWNATAIIADRISDKPALPFSPTDRFGECRPDSKLRMSPILRTKYRKRVYCSAGVLLRYLGTRVACGFFFHPHI